jgi:DNA-binding NarL/FixJ family response regulator
MRQPKLSHEKLIDLLANGSTIRSIAKTNNIKLYTLERQIDRLKTKHNCKTVTQLVVQFKLSTVNNTIGQPE